MVKTMPSMLEARLSQCGPAALHGLGPRPSVVTGQFRCHNISRLPNSSSRGVVTCPQALASTLAEAPSTSQATHPHNGLGELTARCSGSRAVVIGGGMAGLASCRVLADMFDEVVLLERDNLAAQKEGPAKRGGVPQFQQPHVLLVGGFTLFEQLCAGFKEALEQAGGQPVDWLKEGKMFDFGAYMNQLPPSMDSPLRSISATRALFEETARKLVLATANIAPRFGAVVSGLQMADDGRRVAGVVLKGGESLSADLVVDCSGRNSSMTAWLQAAGFTEPPLEEITAGIAYGSRTYAMPEGWFQQNGWKSLVIGSRPAGGRSGMLLPVEHNRWQLILTGLAGDHPPSDEEGYLEFARNLPRPDIYEAISQAQPLTPISLYARTGNVRRRYDEVDLPDGLAVLGDAACCFNPVYGQGMTVGVQGAVLMRDMLRQRARGADDAKLSPARAAAALRGFTKEFQGRLVQLQQFPWTVAAGEDEKNLRCMGKLPPKKPTLGETFLNWYFVQMLRCAMRDPDVLVEMSKVNQMVVPPTHMFGPAISTKVAALTVREALGKVLQPFWRPSGGNDEAAETSAAKA